LYKCSEATQLPFPKICTVEKNEAIKLQQSDKKVQFLSLTLAEKKLYTIFCAMYSVQKSVTVFFWGGGPENKNIKTTTQIHYTIDRKERYIKDIKGQIEENFQMKCSCTNCNCTAVVINSKKSRTFSFFF